MPVIKSAKKKLRQDIKRTKLNKKFEDAYRQAVKLAKKSPTEKIITAAVKAVDKAAKKNIIHNNKAARIKSGLLKLSKSSSRPAEAAVAKKKAAKKVVKKTIKKITKGKKAAKKKR